MSPISKIDYDISSLQNSLWSLPTSHPLRPNHLQALVVARLRRYDLSGAKEDLDSSIVHCTEAIGLPLPWAGPGPNIFRFSFCLVTALIRAFAQVQATRRC